MWFHHTINSTSGVTTYTEFFPVFREIEKYDLVLNLHGEVLGDPGLDYLLECTPVPRIVVCQIGKVVRSLAGAMAYLHPAQVSYVCA